MTVVRELITVLGFDVEEDALRQADKLWSNAKSTARGLTLAISGAGAALAILTKTTSDNIVELDQWSKRLGIGVEALSELGFAAEQERVPAERLFEALTDLGEKASDVFRNDLKGTSDAGESFQALGIDVRGVGGEMKAVDELFDEVIDKLPKLKNESDRTGVAMRLFGDDVGRAVIPLLSKGSAEMDRLRQQARDLGIVVGVDDVRAAREFQKEYSATVSVLGSLRRMVAVGLIPAFSGMLRETREWLMLNRRWIAQRIHFFVDLMARAVAQLWWRARLLAHILGQLIGAFGGTKAVAIALALVFGGALSLNVGAVLLLVRKLILGFGGLQAAMLRTVIIPVLVGAAFLLFAGLLGAVIEDIVVFITKGDEANTLIGKIKKKFFDEGFKASDSPFLAFLKSVAWVMARINDLGKGVASVVSDIVTLASSDTAIGAKGAAKKSLLQTLTGQNDEGKALLAGIAVGLPGVGTALAAGSLGVGHALSVSVPPQGAGGNSTVVTQTIPITVIGAPGQSEAALADEVQRRLDDSTKGASRTFGASGGR